MRRVAVYGNNHSSTYPPLYVAPLPLPLVVGRLYDCSQLLGNILEYRKTLFCCAWRKLMDPMDGISREAAHERRLFTWLSCCSSFTRGIPLNLTI